MMERTIYITGTSKSGKTALINTFKSWASEPTESGGLFETTSGTVSVIFREVTSIHPQTPKDTSLMVHLSRINEAVTFPAHLVGYNVFCFYTFADKIKSRCEFSPNYELCCLDRKVAGKILQMLLQHVFTQPDLRLNDIHRKILMDKQR
jgi:GTPase SAR1 family protein